MVCHLCRLVTVSFWWIILCWPCPQVCSGWLSCPPRPQRCFDPGVQRLFCASYCFPSLNRVGVCLGRQRKDLHSPTSVWMSMRQWRKLGLVLWSVHILLLLCATRQSQSTVLGKLELREVVNVASLGLWSHESQTWWYLQLRNCGVGLLWLITNGNPEMQQKISGHKHR